MSTRIGKRLVFPALSCVSCCFCASLLPVATVVHGNEFGSLRHFFFALSGQAGAGVVRLAGSIATHVLCR